MLGPGLPFATVDIHLAGEQSFAVADLRTEHGMPFMVASGYGVAGLIERYRHVPVLQKPFDPSQLEAIVGRAKASVDG